MVRRTINEPPTGLIERLNERIAELDISQSEAARRAGLHPGFLSDIIAGRKHSIRAAAAVRIAKALQVELDWLRRGEGPKLYEEPLSDEDIAALSEAMSQSPHAVRGAGPSERPSPAARASHWHDESPDIRPKVKIFRSPPGQVDGTLISESAGTIELPFRTASRDAWYAVSVPDYRMSPRYEPGEVLFVTRQGAPRVRDFVVVWFQGAWKGRQAELGVIGRLVRFSIDDLVIAQLLPSDEVIFDLAKVRSVDRIVLSGAASLEADLSLRKQ